MKRLCVMVRWYRLVVIMGCLIFIWIMIGVCRKWLVWFGNWLMDSRKWGVRFFFVIWKVCCLVIWYWLGCVVGRIFIMLSWILF